MNRFEDLPIFENVDKRTRYRAIQLAITRSNVYRKPIVILKLVITFLLTLVAFLVMLGSFSGAVVIGSVVLIGINRIVLYRDFERCVKPLLNECLYEVRRFPNVRK
ncbi:hypothetical protein C1N32_21430 [Vibrio diazotrophicus]|uniref:Uncharacterized protein n=1 Tax=Vibrio diazotrophicus TaxID=685 RepID=A0A2J8HQ46_VIBDI|nr:hypothetical protein C1N32_21430 [Vibrio diazotrophicus]